MHRSWTQAPKAKCGFGVDSPLTRTPSDLSLEGEAKSETCKERTLSLKGEG